jgi:large subunit ribosomal protein L31
MQEGIHPEDYQFVIFKDMSNDEAFLTRSCAQSKETMKWEDGNDYPVIKLEISNTSHPFYTGKMKLVDTAGRIDKFKSRYAAHGKKAAAKKEEAPAPAPEAAAPTEEKSED